MKNNNGLPPTQSSASANGQALPHGLGSLPICSQASHPSMPLMGQTSSNQLVDLMGFDLDEENGAQAG